MGPRDRKASPWNQLVVIYRVIGLSGPEKLMLEETYVACRVGELQAAGLEL